MSYIPTRVDNLGWIFIFLQSQRNREPGEHFAPDTTDTVARLIDLGHNGDRKAPNHHRGGK